jgi:hypothetical protein
MRFVFGGLVALAASLVADAYGPVLGGFFLAFPALLPASLTLVKDHDGREAALDDARGAAIGSLGMGAFALVVWGTAELGAAWLTLSLALLVWALVSVGCWWLLLRPRSPRAQSDRQRHDGCTTAPEIRAHVS